MDVNVAFVSAAVLSNARFSSPTFPQAVASNSSSLVATPGGSFDATSASATLAIVAAAWSAAGCNASLLSTNMQLQLSATSIAQAGLLILLMMSKPNANAFTLHHCMLGWKLRSAYTITLHHCMLG